LIFIKTVEITPERMNFSYQNDFFTSIIGSTSIPNLKFLALANLELWPVGKKDLIG